jgi:ABC-type Na+ efflux pump permease subunit
MTTAPSGLSAVLLIVRKELREALRDRNMVIQLLLMPIFMFPVMGFGGYQVFLILQGASQDQVNIAWVDGEVPLELRESLPDDEQHLFLPTPAELDPSSGAPDADLFVRLRSEFEGHGDEKPLALLSWWSEGDSTYASVLYESSSDRSQEIRSELRSGIRTHQAALAKEHAGSIGLSEAQFEVFDLETENTASASQVARYILSIALPIFLMSMLSHGTFYSAVDTVVGERERSTMETLFSAPLPRSAVLLGKLIFVVISTLVTFTLNLMSLLLFLGFALQLVELPVEVELQIPFTAVLIIIGAVLLLSVTLAAIMMLLALPAKTYREGQAVLTPVHLVVAFSSFAAIGTGQTMSTEQAMIPLLNVVLLCKSVIGGEYSMTNVWISYAVLAALAALSMSLARRFVGREGVFFDPTLNIKRLLRGGFRK